MAEQTKKRRLPAKAFERGRAVGAPARPSPGRVDGPLVEKPHPQARKAKVIAALKRLHPMD